MMIYFTETGFAFFVRKTRKVRSFPDDADGIKYGIRRRIWNTQILKK